MRYTLLPPCVSLCTLGWTWTKRAFLLDRMQTPQYKSKDRAAYAHMYYLGVLFSEYISYIWGVRISGHIINLADTALWATGDGSLTEVVETTHGRMANR